MSSGRSAVWLARTVWVREVEGSNPFAPTSISSISEASHNNLSGR